MKPIGYAFAVVIQSWLAPQASAECNRPEYGAADNWIAPCAKLGVEWLVCRDLFATAKANVGLV